MCQTVLQDHPLAGAHGVGESAQSAGAIELALEGLYLARKISKESGGGETVYG